MRTVIVILVLAVSIVGDGLAHSEAAGAPDASPYTKDRGTGIPTSMFGTYVNHGELLVYPFFEHYRDNDFEYSPQELGYGLDKDFRGRYRANESLIFLGYGLTPAVSVELEGAYIDAKLQKSPDDPSDVPQEIRESGLGDVQTQVNWVWMKETASRPELFSYGEVVYPTQRSKVLIGTRDWEFKVGTGLIRGFWWGTMTLRAAVEYSREERKLGLGEVAIEYLKRLSSAWRLYTGFEGVEDEIELITEMQWHLHRRAFVKFNSGFALTSKATDWAPEIGVMFRL